MTELRGKDRLIVALDVPTHDAALALVDELENVSFFKIGLELLFAGGLFSLLERLHERHRPTGGVFVDLKLAGDIGNTITALVNQSCKRGVRFMTVVESVPLAITLDTIQTVRRARKDDLFPELLMVPYLSSLGTQHLRDIGVQDDVDTYIMKRGKVMVDAGCDGLIVSGQAIRTCRHAFGPTLTLVSPGIRPAWAGRDDHARLTTPAQAIHLGSDYLVVGRPIRTAQSPHDAAQRIIDEIDEALVRQGKVANSPEPTTRAN
ncbi:MAG: orotidine-5'-phosphate decarboxylase [Vicinamibacterales bacterium]|nr:orotidine-5'-phosphate decarboxylase [Vicinamibacterales bacterium]